VAVAPGGSGGDWAARATSVRVAPSGDVMQLIETAAKEVSAAH
jgi:hypothetical protein